MTGGSTRPEGVVDLAFRRCSRLLLHRLSRRRPRSGRYYYSNGFSACLEVFLGGRCYAKDARHNRLRIGHVVMGCSRDATNAAMSTAFGLANLVRFEVATHHQAQVSSRVLSRRSRPRVERRGNHPRRPQARHQRGGALNKLLGAARVRNGETRAACRSL
jgi:hypothetical protein